MWSICIWQLKVSSVSWYIVLSGFLKWDTASIDDDDDDDDDDEDEDASYLLRTNYSNST